jgi:hypothetical protein
MARRWREHSHPSDARRRPDPPTRASVSAFSTVLVRRRYVAVKDKVPRRGPVQDKVQVDVQVDVQVQVRVEVPRRGPASRSRVEVEDKVQIEGRLERLRRPP